MTGETGRSTPSPDDEAARRLRASRAMDAYADGDDAAFRELYACVAPALWGFVSSRVSGRAAAEDVMQQTLLQMHRARGRFRRGSNVYPWMFTIAARLIIDGHRRRRPQVDVDAERLTDGGARPDELVAAAELERHLGARLAALPDRQRRALVLARDEGLSLHEVAQVLGTTVSAVKSLIHRALAELRTVMSGAGALGTLLLGLAL